VVELSIYTSMTRQFPRAAIEHAHSIGVLWSFFKERPEDSIRARSADYSEAFMVKFADESIERYQTE